MFEIELLQEKLALMKQAKAEKEFYSIQGLFKEGIAVSVIVETYAPSFEFEGTLTGLYAAIAKWIDENSEKKEREP